MLAQDNLSSRLTMYDCALANLARSRSSAPRGSCARLRRTTQVTLYSPGCPHLGQVSVWARCSVVSLKKSRSSMVFQLSIPAEKLAARNPGSLLLKRPKPESPEGLPLRQDFLHTHTCHDETQAREIFRHQGRQSQRP